MDDISFKQAYSFVVLLATIGWAVFAVCMTKEALTTKEGIDILAASGTGVVLGALITWTGMTVQHWFRKKGPETEGK